jgi:hypothetical protein
MCSTYRFAEFAERGKTDHGLATIDLSDIVESGSKAVDQPAAVRRSATGAV